MPSVEDSLKAIILILRIRGAEGLSDMGVTDNFAEMSNMLGVGLRLG